MARRTLAGRVSRVLASGDSPLAMHTHRHTRALTEQKVLTPPQARLRAASRSLGMVNTSLTTGPDACVRLSVGQSTDSASGETNGGDRARRRVRSWNGGSTPPPRRRCPPWRWSTTSGRSGTRRWRRWRRGAAPSRTPRHHTSGRSPVCRAR
uniref:Uncharacterized protein n=1 Tax=Arundo donax TaxID=35708 RepID=A0A0A9GEM8_ARUDO